MKSTTLVILALSITSVLIGCVENNSQPPPPLAFFENDDNGSTGNNQTANSSNQTNQTNQTNSSNNQEPIDGADGKACQISDDCLSGQCMSGVNWPDGHCTTRECSSDSDCQGRDGQNSCFDHPTSGSICVRSCEVGSNDECRDGYTCLAISGEEGWCAPSGHDINATGLPFDVTCSPAFNGSVTFSYEIAPTTTSYMVVPYNTTNDWIYPMLIDLPSGGSINFQQGNRFQLSAFAYYGINPIIVPAIPQTANQLESGTHNFTLSTGASEICHYIIQSSSTPTTLDLNIYLVGLEGKGITAETAATNSNLQQVLTEANLILQSAGLSLGKIRYLDVSTAVRNAYRIIQSDNDVFGLLSHSKYPGNDVDSALSVNVFITEQFTYGPLGVSAGAPGVAGIHEIWFSGVVLSGEYIGMGNQGNQYTSVTVAHEIGHFLGLEHTSETSGDRFDPLDDTAECHNFDPNQPWHCPDWGNLMFPIAGPGNTTLTNDQSFVLSVSPLTK